MTDVQNIPLKKLTAWDGNVRKTGADTALAELAASIAAHGLLQSLVVRKDKRGRYAVIAGRRRLLALQTLAESGRIDPDYAVPCQVLDSEADATEVSLAENTQREAMHPADEFEAFRALADGGMPAADIAARFGTSETLVHKRLKLARVSPVIIEAYRNEGTTLECLMAFAASDDHAAQERLWKGGPEWVRTSARGIRRALTEHETTATDRRVQFVTLKAYEKAGGNVRRDLFSEDEDGVFILDTALLDQLAIRKLEKIAKSIRKEGWKWVEAVPAFDYEARSGFERRYPEQTPLSEEEAAELESLETEADAFHDIEGELDEEQQARFDAICERIDALNDRAEIWPDETLAIAGAVVSIGHDGEADIVRGLVRPEDVPAEASDEETETGGVEAAQETGPAYPAALTESLTAQRSAALTAVLMDNPRVALAAAVHAMADDVFRAGGFDSCLQLSASRRSLHRVEGSRAAEAVLRAAESWGSRLPGDSQARFAWCLEQDQAVLLDLLAFCAALTIDAVQVKNDRLPQSRFEHASALAAALELDMRAWFTPDAGNYFGRVSKTQILAALQEGKGSVAPAWGKFKKAELASLAERELAGTGWLPEPLRAA